MSRPDDTTIPWPVGREYHSSCLLAGPLTGHQYPVVVVVGGEDNNEDTLSDLWIMQREQTWKKVCPGIMNNTRVHVYVCWWCLFVSWVIKLVLIIWCNRGYIMYHTYFSGLMFEWWRELVVTYKEVGIMLFSPYSENPVAAIHLIVILVTISQVY